MNEPPPVKASEIIRVAREWLGTPYQHQGRDRYGLDCFGLGLVVGWKLGITALEQLGYSSFPDGVMAERLLRQECTEKPKEDTRPGDIIAVDYGSGVQHIAFVTSLDPLSVIHAKRPKSGIQKGRGVVEHRLIKTNEDYRGWRFTFQLPGVIYDV